MRFPGALLALFFGAAALAAPGFPTLTGRVVDNARLLSPQGKARLEQALAEHEAKTSEQIVVVTIPTLNGTPIEDYGYQLGRDWGIGQKGKNNGALLIIAPVEREVRIEVGYGLEGKLTDAMSKQIIESIILPRFREGRMEQGILDGATAIVSLLEGKPIGLSSAPPGTQGEEIDPLFLWIFLLLFLHRPFLGLLSWFLALFGFYGLRNYLASHPRRGGFWIFPGGGFGGGGAGGGFRGGGGGFGGGGSSGKW
jgi:uncharacterized protein